MASSCNASYADATPKLGPSYDCLTRGESFGLAFVSVAGIISLVALSVAFIRIARNFRREREKPFLQRGRLITRPMDLFLLSLFIAKFIVSIAMALNIKWVPNGIVYVGAACRVQGGFVSFGLTTSAMTTIVIAIHTFSVFWQGRSMSLCRAWVIVSVIWLYPILFITIDIRIHGGDNTFRPSGFWCSFPKDAWLQKIVGEYLWMLLAIAISFVLYVRLFLWGRGHIAHAVNQDMNREDALSLIYYPIVYAITILPNAVVRLIEFRQDRRGEVPSMAFSAVVLTSRCILALTGLSNVLLYLITRPKLLLLTH